MRYKIHYPGVPERIRKPSTVITRDERVVWTTPAMSWAVQCTLATVLDWARRRRMTVELVNADCSPVDGDFKR